MVFSLRVEPHELRKHDRNIAVFISQNVYSSLNILIAVWICDTVQTFNSCTSRPVVCQYLVEKAPVDNMSNYNPSTSMAHVACESKSRSLVRLSVYSCPGNWWQAGVWSCLVPRHLVQELNVGIVHLEVTQRWHMNSPHKWKEVLGDVQMNYSSSNISQ